MQPQGETIRRPHVNLRHRRGQCDQRRIAEVVDSGIPGREQVFGNSHDCIHADPARINQPGVVGRALAELEPGDRVRALAEGHLKLWRLEPIRLQIRFGIIGQELAYRDALQQLQ